MKEMKMTVPTATGSIEVDMTEERLCVRARGVDCKVSVYGKTCDLTAGKEITLYR